MSILYKHEPRNVDERELMVTRMRDAIADGIDDVTAESKSILARPGDGFDTGDHARRIEGLVMDQVEPLLPPEASPGRFTIFDTLATYVSEAAARHSDLLQVIANRADLARVDPDTKAPSVKPVARNAELMVATAVRIAGMRGRGILDAAEMTPHELADAAKADRHFNVEMFDRPDHLGRVAERQQNARADYSL
jgi:hypothetical protein